MLPSWGKICEFVIAENLKIWKFENARVKQASLHGRKSREIEILIKSTRREGAKIMN